MPCPLQQLHDTEGFCESAKRGGDCNLELCRFTDKNERKDIREKTRDATLGQEAYQTRAKAINEKVARLARDPSEVDRLLEGATRFLNLLAE